MNNNSYNYFNIEYITSIINYDDYNQMNELIRSICENIDNPEFMRIIYQRQLYITLLNNFNIDVIDERMRSMNNDRYRIQIYFNKLLKWYMTLINYVLNAKKPNDDYQSQRNKITSADASDIVTAKTNIDLTNVVKLSQSTEKSIEAQKRLDKLELKKIINELIITNLNSKLQIFSSIENKSSDSIFDVLDLSEDIITQYKDLQSIIKNISFQSSKKVKLLSDNQPKYLINFTDVDNNIIEKFSIINSDIFIESLTLLSDPNIFCDIWNDYAYDTNDKNSKYNEGDYENLLEENDTTIHLVIEYLQKLFIEINFIYLKDLFNNRDKELDIYIKRDTTIFKAVIIKLITMQIPRLTKEFITKYKNNPINNYINVETEIPSIVSDVINNYILAIYDNNKSYIFSYQLLMMIYNKNTEKDIYSNNVLIQSELDFSKIGGGKLNVVVEYYLYNLILKSISQNLQKIRILTQEPYKKKIHAAYLNFFKKNSNILTFVKERNDASLFNYDQRTINPRYHILAPYNSKDSRSIVELITEDNPDIKYYDLRLNYFNEPKVIGLESNDQQYYDENKLNSYITTNSGDFNEDDLYNDKIYNYSQNKAEQYVENNQDKIETYNFGSINGYFHSHHTTQDITNSSNCGKILLNKIINGEDIIIIGYGQSGAGKTSTLINLSKTIEGETIETPGLLPSIAKQLINPNIQNLLTCPTAKDYKVNIENLSNTNYFTLAKCKIINIYTKLDDNLIGIENFKDINYLNYSINLPDIISDPKSGEITLYPLNINNKLDWYAHKTNGQCESFGKIIDIAFQQREIFPTKNNANSSRSHIIVCITFEKQIIDPETLQPKINTSKVVICDLAGVEDKFTCNFNELVNLDINYSTKSDKYKCNIDPDKESKLSDYDKLICNNNLHYNNKKPTNFITFDNYLCDNDIYKSEIVPKTILVDRASYIISMHNIKSIYNFLKINDIKIHELVKNNYEKILNKNIVDIDYIKIYFKNYLNLNIYSNMTNDIDNIDNFDNLYNISITTNENLNKNLDQYLTDNNIIDNKIYNYAIEAIRTILPTTSGFTFSDNYVIPSKISPDILRNLVSINDFKTICNNINNYKSSIPNITDNDINTVSKKIKDLESFMQYYYKLSNNITSNTKLLRHNMAVIKQKLLTDIINILDLNTNSELITTDNTLIIDKTEEIETILVFIKSNFTPSFVSTYKYNQDNLETTQRNLDKSSSEVASMNDKYNNMISHKINYNLLFNKDHIIGLDLARYENKNHIFSPAYFTSFLIRVVIGLKINKEICVYDNGDNYNDYVLASTYYKSTINGLTITEVRRSDGMALNLVNQLYTGIKENRFYYFSRAVYNKSDITIDFLKDHHKVIPLDAYYKKSVNILYDSSEFYLSLKTEIDAITSTRSFNSKKTSYIFVNFKNYNDDTKLISDKREEIIDANCKDIYNNFKNTLSDLLTKIFNSIVNRTNENITDILSKFLLCFDLDYNSCRTLMETTIFYPYKFLPDKYISKLLNNNESVLYIFENIDNNNHYSDHYLNFQNNNCITLNSIITYDEIVTANYNSDILADKIIASHTFIKFYLSVLSDEFFIKANAMSDILHIKWCFKIKVNNKNDTIVKYEKQIEDTKNLIKNNGRTIMDVKNKIKELVPLVVPSIIKCILDNLKIHVTKEYETRNEMLTLDFEIKIKDYIRLHQLEYNCIIRRQEGYMINTSLREMQKFISSLILENAKSKFNKNMINNNLIKLHTNDSEKIIYKINDIYKFQNNKLDNYIKVQSILNKLNTYTETTIPEVDNDITNLQNDLFSILNIMKKNILKELYYILHLFNNDTLKTSIHEKKYLDLSLVLYEICFIDILNRLFNVPYINKQSNITETNNEINFNLVLEEIINCFNIFTDKSPISSWFNMLISEIKHQNISRETINTRYEHILTVSELSIIDDINIYKKNLESQTNLVLNHLYIMFTHIFNPLNDYKINNRSYKFNIESTTLDTSQQSGNRNRQELILCGLTVFLQYNYLLQKKSHNFILFDYLIHIILLMYRETLTQETGMLSQEIIDTLIYHTNSKAFYLSNENNAFTVIVNNVNVILDKIIILLKNKISLFDQYRSTLYKKIGSILPLIYNPPQYYSSTDTNDSCRINTIKYNNEFELYNKLINSTSPLEILFRIMMNKTTDVIPGFELNMSNTTIVIFTVINLTPHPILPVNNPPTPPYINTNKLKLIYKLISTNASMMQTLSSRHKTSDAKIRELYDKVINYKTSFLTKINTYDFYNNFLKHGNIYFNILNNNNQFFNVQNLLQLINFIESNNASTLIGTLEFEKFTQIRNVNDVYFICDGNNHNLLQQSKRIEVLSNIDFNEKKKQN